MKRQYRNHFAPPHITFLSHMLYSVIVLALIATGCATTEQPALKIGFGETVITPEMDNVPMRGYAARNSTGVHDDLYTRTMVIEGSDGTTVALMTVAVCNMRVQFMEDIRAQVESQTGIPADNIIISCTHTHSGPHVGRAGEKYQKFIIDRSVASAIDAWNSRTPSRIGTATTIVRGLGMNDRRMFHGGLHADPEAGVIKVEDASGKLTGVAFIYGCHPSTLDLHNLLFTEDWPYYSIKGLKEELGDDVWVAYYQSAQGDAKVGYTAELSAVGADMSGLRSFEFAEYKGRMMIDPVVAVLDSITTSGDPAIAAVRHTIDLPLRETYPVTYKEALANQKQAKEKLAEMEEHAESYGKRVLDFQRVEVFLANQMVGGAKWIEEHPDPEPLKDIIQQAVKIGDTAIVTFPNEVFTEIGRTVKDASPFGKTMILGLASGHGGYVPTAAEFLEGGYAVNGSRFSPKCERVLIEESTGLMAQLK